MKKSIRAMAVVMAATIALSVGMMGGAVGEVGTYSKQFESVHGNVGVPITVNHIIKDRTITVNLRAYGSEKAPYVNASAPVTLTFDESSMEPTCSLVSPGPVDLFQVIKEDASDIIKMEAKGYRIYDEAKAEWTDVEEVPGNYKGEYYFRKGLTMTFEADGLYLVKSKIKNSKKNDVIIVQVGDGVVKSEQEQLGTQKAVKTMATVLVDGKKIAFDAYEIEDSNYFKLRDIAMTVKGSSKQFSVMYDEMKHAITMYSQMDYNIAGGELQPGNGASVITAVKSNAAVYVDGTKENFDAYEINDNNYFKLRDIAKAFNIGIGWDGAANTITIDTTKGYTKA